MKLLLLLSALLLPLAQAQTNQLSETEKKEGFTLLFDGESLDGWRGYKKDAPTDQWKVVDGAITLTAPKGGDLISKKTYQDFELRLEFNIAPEGNSGIMWHVAETKGPSYMTGAEFQILDPTTQEKYPQEVEAGNVSGGLYGIVKSKPEWSKPAGEWNEARLRVEGTRITFHINGHKSVDIDTSTDEWSDMLAKTKFANWPQFNKMKEGHLCFQDHGDVVAFRSIRLKELK